MYRNACWLTCWNQNCKIPIHFRTPVCQINENRQISAESEQNFHFLPHFKSKTIELIFTIFLYNIEQLVELLMHTSARQLCISFQNTRAKSEDGQFWHLQKSSKINSLQQQRPLDYHKTYVSFVIPIHTSTKAETLVKIGSVVVEIFSETGCFLPYRFKSTNFSHLNLWHYFYVVIEQHNSFIRSFVRSFILYLPLKHKAKM